MIAYIPARGGSKRIPRKNIRLLKGKPVLQYVIETLRKLSFIDDVFVSTDDPEIASLAERAGGKSLALRTAVLSNDTTGFLELVEKDVPRYLETHTEKNEFLFCLATAALIDVSIYEQAFEKFKSSSCDVLISANRFEPSPYRALVKDGKKIRPLFPKEIDMRTQDMPETFVDAGCFYLIRRDQLLRSAGFLLGDLDHYLIPKDQAIDVDSEADWLALERAFTLRTSVAP